MFSGWGDSGENGAGIAWGMSTYGIGVGDGSKDRPVPQTRTRWHALVACHTEVLAAHPQPYQQYGLRALLHGGGRVEEAGFQYGSAAWFSAVSHKKPASDAGTITEGCRTRGLAVAARVHLG